MNKSEKIISDINSNGGLDISYIERAAKLDRCTIREYIVGYIKSGYNVHGNTANKVADYFAY